MTNNKSNMLPIVVMFLLFFMIAFVTNFAGSMGVIVKTQFGASNAMAQLGTLANFIAYAVMGVPAGIILKRKGYKFTSLLAVSVGFVGVGIQWLSGYAESFGVIVEHFTELCHYSIHFLLQFGMGGETEQRCLYLVFIGYADKLPCSPQERFVQVVLHGNFRLYSTEDKGFRFVYVFLSVCHSTFSVCTVSSGWVAF